MAKYFEDLEVFRESRALTNSIYRITAAPEFSKDFGLRDQIRRAAVSVMANVAEGFERGGNQEFMQFLSIAKGSCGEVRAQLYVAADQGYLTASQREDLIATAKRLSGMISNLMEYLKGSGMKGAKFKRPQSRTIKEEMDNLLKELSETPLSD